MDLRIQLLLCIIHYTYTEVLCNETQELTFCDYYSCENNATCGRSDSNFGLRFRCICDSGFAGYFCQHVAGCDIDLNVTDTKQHVATEGYPHEYDRLQDCDFNFKAPSGRKIIVEFVHFWLRSFDYIIFPNNVAYSRDPPTFRSDSNTATLRFKSFRAGRYWENGILMAYMLDVDDCSTSPCENGAICVDEHGGYTCQCTDQWLGDKCTEFNNCHPNPCINGTCEDFNNTYTCSCFDGYKGTNCDEINPACSDIICQNGGSCVYINETSNAVCSCYNNFAGEFCEDSICGKSAIPPVTIFKNKKRIVGGMEVVANAWPWQVSIQSSGSHKCGGSIISPEFIVTADHCDPGVNDTILLGAHDVTNCEQSEGCIKVQITEVWSHINSKIGGSYYNDIAVAKFSPPISQFTDKISPVCLPQTGDDKKLPNWAHCYSTGWGHGSGSNDLYQVHLQLKSGSLCEQLVDPPWRWPHYFDQDLMICAGTGGRSACYGDYGGPLMCRLPGQENWKLFGIASFGRQCGARSSPGVFTRVVKYIDWIQNILGQ